MGVGRLSMGLQDSVTHWSHMTQLQHPLAMDARRVPRCSARQGWDVRSAKWGRGRPPAGAAPRARCSGTSLARSQGCFSGSEYDHGYFWNCYTGPYYVPNRAT